MGFLRKVTEVTKTEVLNREVKEIDFPKSFTANFSSPPG